MKGCVAAVASVLAVFAACASSGASEPDRIYPVGISQVEFADSHYGPRTLSMAVFYPAVVSEGSPRFVVPFFANLTLYKDAEIAFDGNKRPLIMLSHGRGSTGLSYAWFAQTLASHGYIVAAPYHWRANSYDSTIAYLANRLWQRPVDVSLDIDFLLSDPAWSKYLDADRIGVAGHSQGGFTALWLGGAKVNRDKYLAFQQGWRNNQQIPEHIRDELPLDPEPALNVKDARVKAVFAMAPGIIKAFGMDEAGLKQLDMPAYITVGAGDTQTPPAENAEFAAKYIPHAEFVIIPGAVDHEIFVNECDDEGKDEFPEACKDAPGVDRAAIHASVGSAAVKFFDTALSR
ncbi:alpha/beta hydrolase family protein [Methyloceanibacter sp.]|uniref:alpha/beta hydrolase family protein n=1 Tax=Methyloceanibacter sp. TaxID=1965321 RepID=UPI003D6CE897